MKKYFLVMILLCTTVFFISACGSQSSSQSAAVKKSVRGVTDTEIVLGSFIDQSGPSANAGVPRAKVLDAFWKYINDKGGINGRKIKWIAEDDQSNPQKAVVAVKKMVEQDKIFAIISSMGSPSNAAVKDYMIQNSLSNLFPYDQTNTLFDRPIPGFYHFMPTYEVEGAIAARWAIETQKKQRIAIFYISSQFGKDGLAGVKEAVAKLNGQVVAEVPFNVNEPDFSSHAIKLKNSNADIIIAVGPPGQFATAFKETRKLGFKADWLNIMGVNKQKADLIGPDFEGTYGLDMRIPDLKDTSNPEVKEFRDFMAKYAPSQPDSELQWQAWDVGMHTVELLTRAGKDLTLQSIDTAAYTFKDWGRWKVTWTPTQHLGNQVLSVTQWKDGKINVVSPPISADLIQK